MVTGVESWPLVLTGEAGRGKTMAALCVADHCRWAEYFTVSGLCEILNRAKFQGGLTWTHEGHSGTWYATDIWRIIGEASLVILDELGSRENVSDAQYETVKDVIDSREDKPFIAISNLKLEQLSSVYDGRISSRLSQGTLFEVGGKDRRLS